MPVRITSYLLIGVGIILAALSLFFGGTLDLGLPLVFMVLGAGFFFLALNLRRKWNWAPILFVPGSLLAALGIILLVNGFAHDRAAWAYAWLFLVAASGVGLLLANRSREWPPLIDLIGWGMTIAGFTLFALFGAISGGLFIRIMAPVLIVLAGVAVRWLDFSQLRGLFIHKNLLVPSTSAVGASNPSSGMLVEPLSGRELDVLRLIHQGFTNQQIAGRLIVAPSTVKTHINNIYGKLGVQTRVQAVNRARELGLLPA